MTTHKPVPTIPIRVIVFLQENKTTDFYFPTLSAWGAEIHQYGTLLAAPPDYNQPHDRSSWVHYKMGDYPALALSLDNDTVIPYYSWLAKTFTFCDHHFGAGSNSTSGHMLAIGGQMPTLKNPRFGPGGPEWDLPSIFLQAERAGIGWAAFPATDGYPTKFYKELITSSANSHIHTAAEFLTMAQAGTLPQLVYSWSPDGSDEHPPAQSDPGYITRGHDFIWQRVDAVVKAGQWHNTVFILTWDDWGGYADHVATPDAEIVPDELHAQGFQIIGGSRIPLIMFGGQVKQGIDNHWHSHASIPKTIIDILGLSPMGIPRVDGAPSLIGSVQHTLSRPEPPAYGSTITQPVAPIPTPKPIAPPAWNGPVGQLLTPLVANGGMTIAAPTDGDVKPKPPKLPVH